MGWWRENSSGLYYYKNLNSIEVYLFRRHLLAILLSSMGYQLWTMELLIELSIRILTIFVQGQISITSDLIWVLILRSYKFLCKLSSKLGIFSIAQVKVSGAKLCDEALMME